MKRQVFGSISAQHDNLGDIAIRRVFFESHIEAGHSLVLLSHRMPQAYIDLFHFSDGVTLVRSPLLFQVRLLVAALQRRANLVYAPGPHNMADSVRGIAKTLLMVGNVAMIRVSGGKVTTAGRALRGAGSIAKALERLIISMSSVYAVRDSVSGDNVGANLATVPDIALGVTVGPNAGSRNTIAFSFRNDIAVSQAVVRKLAEAFQSEGFKVTLVSQVRRDDKQHAALAEELNLEAVLWGDLSHEEQQSRVEDVYRSARAVMSNRLHGLIFGITAGAIPIEFRAGKSDKISTTLGPWFGNYPSICNDDPVDEIDVDAVVAAVQHGIEEFDQKREMARTKVRETLEAVTRAATSD
ncbi:hypothetical protein [Arthrobacter sp. NPDC093139]|uniref:hypothetical protein n=1 Tax=Arthrobacter sp. NPDC093139 TaxID=3363945 RepID=UPI003802FEA7